MTVHAEPAAHDGKDTVLVNLRDRAGLTTAEAAAFMGVGYSTMKNWRTEGIGPRYAKIGSTVLYRPADLDAYLEERLIGSRRRRR